MNNAKPSVMQRLKDFVVKKFISFKKNANIVRELVKKNIKVQYRNSAIGALWTVLNPLLNMLVMFFVFSTVFSFGKEDPWYSLYILCGNIMFSFVRSATTQSLPSIVDNRGLLTKNKISQYVFPVAKNFSAVVNFAFSSVALIGVMGIVSIVNYKDYGTTAFSPALLLVFLMLPALFMFSFGLSLILSSLYVYFRDVQHFYSVFLTLWTYLTPIFWKLGNLEGKPTFKAILEFVVNLNPMYHFVEYFRDIAYRCAAEGVTIASTFPTLGILYVLGLAFLTFGWIVFAITRHDFIYHI